MAPIPSSESLVDGTYAYDSELGDDFASPHDEPTLLQITSGGDHQGAQDSHAITVLDTGDIQLSNASEADL